jgi:hypothetical protein
VKNSKMMGGAPKTVKIRIFPILWGSARLRQLKIVSSQRD